MPSLLAPRVEGGSRPVRFGALLAHRTRSTQVAVGLNGAVLDGLLETVSRLRWPWRPTMHDEVAPLIRVKHARVLARYIVELTFADGAVKVIDLEPRLWGELFAPMRAAYGEFCGGQAGTIVWPNGADLSPRMLYAQAQAAVPA